MKSAETIIQWDEFRRSLIKQCHTRGTQGISITLFNKPTVDFPQELGSQDLKQPCSRGPGPRPLPSLQSIPWYYRRSSILFSIHQGLSESSQGLVPRLLVAQPNMFLVLRNNASFSLHKGLVESLTCSGQPLTQQCFPFQGVVTQCGLTCVTELCFSQEENWTFMEHQA